MTSPHIPENTSLNSSEGIGMSNSTEMVERVARAMQGSKAWPVVFDAGSAQELARVAIEAMLEPTAAMLRPTLTPVMQYDADRDSASILAMEVWDAMISAALSPEDEGSQSK